MGAMAEGPDGAARELCRADTSGISLRERTDDGEDVFRWIAIAGRMRQHLHGTTPPYLSPCGITVGEVIEGVCAELLGSAGTRFRYNLEADEVSVPAHKAAVLALIVNELLTNALRHGLADRPRGSVTVELRRTGAGTVALSIADDGVPLPAGVASGQLDGLGLDLVRRLADQLGGELRIGAEPKWFTVVFPAGETCH